ncbi:hypothetical protein PDESU_05083 [Pontiella desulfatans]|uniref:Uncharacterized protein n=1 Tax=Pontiella desulfatans TaxID=2750659 RepID=A0A6C2U8Q2_PONDE|nr:hypothetical protein [Pontiella desulfatans]VGO16492.1 hypothetical protein PDESU_05083 [Pontiella desulfatans]
METTEKVIAGAFVTVVGVSMLGTCSRNRSTQEEYIRYSPQPVPVPPAVDSVDVRAAEGIINLNEVRDSFRATHEMAVFEQRVNEIYEGEQMVVFEAKEVGNGFQLLAREDLDGSKSTTASDDLLFTLSVMGREATLKGHGANDYYKETWLYEPPADAAERVREVHHHSSFASSPFFWWWLLSPGWGGYYTPMARYDSMYAYRGGYRNSGAYRDQVSRNTSYARSKSSSFRNTSSTMSSQRKSYVSKMPSTSGYKQKMAASARKTGTSAKSQTRTSGTKSGSFSGTSNKSSSSKGYGGFRGSSGF